MTKKTLRIQQVNITQLDKNGQHLVASNADIIGIAEHKLAKNQVSTWKNNFKEAGNKLVCGPSDFTRKVPQAGVAIVGGSKVSLIETKIKT